MSFFVRKTSKTCYKTNFQFHFTLMLDCGKWNFLSLSIQTLIFILFAMKFHCRLLKRTKTWKKSTSTFTQQKQTGVNCSWIFDVDFLTSRRVPFAIHCITFNVEKNSSRFLQIAWRLTLVTFNTNNEKIYNNNDVHFIVAVKKKFPRYFTLILDCMNWKKFPSKRDEMRLH